MLFRRNKEGPYPQSPEQKIPDSETRLSMGAHTLEVIEKNPDKSYDQELRERMQEVKTMHEEFIKEALERGVPEEELSALVADAMTAKELPGIIEGMSYKGSGFTVMFLEGDIPHDFLSVKPLYEEDKFVGVRVSVERMPETDENVTIEKSPRLPQENNGQPVDNDILSKFDTRINPLGIEA